jgi:hypothetical protein
MGRGCLWYSKRCYGKHLKLTDDPQMGTSAKSLYVKGIPWRAMALIGSSRRVPGRRSRNWYRNAGRNNSANGGKAASTTAFWFFQRFGYGTRDTLWNGPTCTSPSQRLMRWVNLINIKCQFPDNHVPVYTHLIICQSSLLSISCFIK